MIMMIIAVSNTKAAGAHADCESGKKGSPLTNEAGISLYVGDSPGKQKTVTFWINKKKKKS